MSVIIEFSRCIGTYSSAKFELIILELKNGKSAKEAIEQIHSKKYYMGLKEKGYTGEVLLVGINYNKDKEHECLIESLKE